ncbi:hypothetical protein LP089_08510 [Moraxella bovis]|uniref:hypothetical protein n=1 Tax=Moraxella bovis TaxID=476 RepID=UPI002227FB20|nr:hypothetical protein [Moraxella bovis]UYZ70174.1 hypothetical protein LP089_08510 [Moraxella bovis]
MPFSPDVRDRRGGFSDMTVGVATLGSWTGAVSDEFDLSFSKYHAPPRQPRR